MTRGRLDPPDDPLARAAIERIGLQRAKGKGAPAEAEAAPGRQTARLQELLSPAQIRTLRQGTEQETGDVLASIPAEELGEVVIAMPQGMRQRLLATADAGLRRKLILASAPQQLVPMDLTEAKLYRAIYSERQLQEQMADFWFNHFNVFLDKGADRVLTTSYERDAIRPHVLGKFRDLLEATAAHPAMLFYLDNWQSVAPDRVQRGRFGRLKGKQGARGLNENYARELMELHTLGVDGGYTQKDILEVARCFTGWTIRQPFLEGEFAYDGRLHDQGEKTVLGVTIPAGGGREDAEKVLDILARHPSTARFLSTKLAQKFVADDPPPALINSMAKTFRETDGDIRAVMSAMIHSREFSSQGAVRAKIKTPLELIASAVRATGADTNYAMPLANQIAQLGQPLFRKQEPTGYSSLSAEWVNSAALLGRMNFALALAANRVPGVVVEGARFQGRPEQVARMLLFQEPAAATLASVEKALEGPRSESAAQAPVTVAGLVLGSPDFQRK
jgi:uncharacterized protein (DUF1800 family)